MRLLIVAILVLAASRAEAGPYCWNEVGFAPRGADLPIAPTIAFASHPRYYGGLRYKPAEIPELFATIEGKRVAMIWTDVPISGGGKTRLYSVRSQATGKLELWRRWPYGDGKPEVAAEYTIRKDWTPGEVTAEVREGSDVGIGVYGWVGSFAELRTSVPALLFTARWRANSRAAWQSLTLPVHHNDKDARAEARLGEDICGMHENIPMAALARGIEIEVSAKLPNGRVMPVVTRMPLTFVPSSKPPPKPQRATEPPWQE